MHPDELRKRIAELAGVAMARRWLRSRRDAMEVLRSPIGSSDPGILAATLGEIAPESARTPMEDDASRLHREE